MLGSLLSGESTPSPSALLLLLFSLSVNYSLKKKRVITLKKDIKGESLGPVYG